jgi:hypothetical protein
LRPSGVSFIPPFAAHKGMHALFQFFQFHERATREKMKISRKEAQRGKGLSFATFASLRELFSEGPTQSWLATKAARSASRLA